MAGNGKNPDGQGFKSGDFFALFAKKYYSSLDHLDSRNGVKCRLLFMIGSGIIFSVQTDTRDLYTFLIQIFGGNFYVFFSNINLVDCHCIQKTENGQNRTTEI